MRGRRSALISLGTMALTACASVNRQAAPVVVTSEVTRVVTKVATQIVRQTVVVTATAEAIAAETTQLPALPTMTGPTPVVPPEAAPPTVVITAESAEEQLPKARAVRDIQVYHLPDEENYNIAGSLPAGAEMFVVYRGGQWFLINDGTGEDALVGWVYRDWIDLPADQYERIPLWPDPEPVLVGHVVQEFLAGSTIFKGRVFNVGAATAQGVRVEVELFDAADRRVDIADALTDPWDIGGQQQASFSVIVRTDEFETYIARTRWDNR